MVKPFPIVFAPNPVFRSKAEPVKQVDEEVREQVQRMFTTMEAEHAVGIGANMVGLLRRIIVVHLRGDEPRYAMINPEITSASSNMQEFEEASVSFPGISAHVKRPDAITVAYLDEQGNRQELKAEGFLATVIQHEIDYLDGKLFVDYLSKMKREMLLKKSEKFLKNNPPHVHTEHCRH